MLIIILFLINSCTVREAVPPIKDKESLIRSAEPILFKTYGKEHILGEKPYVISFKDGIWVMDGTLLNGYKGGTFHIVINAKDGKVIKMIHYK